MRFSGCRDSKLFPCIWNSRPVFTGVVLETLWSRSWLWSQTVNVPMISLSLLVTIKRYIPNLNKCIRQLSTSPCARRVRGFRRTCPQTCIICSELVKCSIMRWVGVSKHEKWPLWFSQNLEKLKCDVRGYFSGHFFIGNLSRRPRTDRDKNRKRQKIHPLQRQVVYWGPSLRRFNNTEELHQMAGV